MSASGIRVKQEPDMQSCAQVSMQNYGNYSQAPSTSYQNYSQAPSTSYQNHAQVPMPNYENYSQAPSTSYQNRAQVPMPSYENYSQAPSTSYQNHAQVPMPNYENYSQAPSTSYQERHNDDSMPSCSRAGSSQNNISDQELTSLSVKDLNRQLKDLGCVHETVQQMKQRRRTLKNRGYASELRSRHIEKTEELQARNDRLREAIEKMKIETKEINEKLQQEAEYHKAMLDICYKNNMLVPAEFLNLP